MKKKPDNLKIVCATWDLSPEMKESYSNRETSEPMYKKVISISILA
jgi:hypothetical protein